MHKEKEPRQKKKKWKPTLYGRVGTISGHRGEHTDDDYRPGRLGNPISNSWGK